MGLVILPIKGSKNISKIYPFIIQDEFHFKSPLRLRGRGLTNRHGDAGHEELHGVVPLLPLGLRVHVLLLSSVLDETVQSEQPDSILKLR